MGHLSTEYLYGGSCLLVSKDDGLAANSERSVLVCWLVFYL